MQHRPAPLRTLAPVLTLAMAFSTAMAQDSTMVVRDLEGKSPKLLTKDELQQLLPGAKMSRLTGKGNSHFWTNDADGSLIISSDNRDKGNTKSTTAPGKWHVSDDGRYCVLFDWRKTETEEWCRYIIQTSDGYYATKSDRVGTERVYLLQIKK